MYTNCYLSVLYVRILTNLLFSFDLPILVGCDRFYCRIAFFAYKSPMYLLYNADNFVPSSPEFSSETFQII
jgi:hypothetical protein